MDIQNLDKSLLHQLNANQLSIMDTVVRWEISRGGLATGGDAGE
ncbi:hypothetical protein [Rhodohalobacter sp. SW132]|nr:hypothetical protein [Rhodohalobacter sp. SW132]